MGSLRHLPAMVVLAAVLAACATPKKGPRTSYQPPSSMPAAQQTVISRGDPLALLAGIGRDLEQKGFEVTTLDAERRLLAAQASVPPASMLDCGWIIDRDASGTGLMPAATGSLVLQAGGQSGRVVRRTMEAEARVVVTAERIGGGRTLLTSRAYYVVIKTETSDKGALISRELTFFGTGESGEFQRGSRCHGNGRLEREVLVSLS